MTTISTDVQTLSLRLDALERQNRRMRRAGLAIFVVLGGSFLMGQAVPKEIPEVISAHSFRAVDKDGEPRAWFGAGDTGSSLYLGEKDGQQSAVLRVDSGAPMLALSDKDGVIRTCLIVKVTGTSSLTFDDKDRKTRVELDLTRDGIPGLTLKDKDEMPRASVFLTDDGKPRIALELDKNGKTTWKAPDAWR